MSSNDDQERFDEAVHEIYSVYPSLSPDKTYLNRQWPELARHLPQVLGLEKEIQENETLTPNKKFAVILCNATWYLFEQNELEKVAELLSTLYTVTMATATGNEFFVAQIYRLFLVMKLDAREYALARAYATKMLEALKSLKAVDPFALADGYNAVGLCMLGVGNYPGAEYYLRRSPTLREEFPDRNAGMRGITLANLALCHNLRGQYVEALKRGKQGLKLVEEHLGKGSFKAAE
jgi:tetratricopeptide (TPR) repeat protein